MTFQRVGVLGSGIMGSGIAEVVAGAGADVLVRTRSQATADAMLAGLEKSLTRQVEKEKRTRDEADQLRSRVSATTSIADLHDCDLVIETVVEDLSVKRALFNELDRAVNHHAVLATNTSTLSVIELAMETSRPELVCGLHFFNPAPAMSVVEIVRPLCASDSTIQSVIEFAEACGKEAVEVKDQAGFVVNALLFPYLNTSLAILDSLYDEFADPNFAPVPLLRRMVSAGQLGRKSGTGFYDYRR
jgi:3-hydroxybutyryl-CoA dehydrogenase